MLSELEQKPGDPFSLKKMLSGQKNLRDMDVFKSVSFQPKDLSKRRMRSICSLVWRRKKLFISKPVWDMNPGKAFF